MAPEILFIRKAYDRGSLVTILKRLPSSLRKSLDFGPMVPHASTATWWNWYMRSRWAYFLVLSSSACATAPSGSVAALRQCDWQKVSTHVASHTRCFPCSQGAIVIPSGRFPSAQCNPEGSSREGIFAPVRACWMILFTVLWRDSLPWLDWHLRPCLKNWSTSLPQYVSLLILAIDNLL